MLKDFRTYQLATEYYQVCKTVSLPIHLRDQFRRASASIGLNLAEGSAKRTFADQRRYYFNALGSLRETQAILDLEKIRIKILDDIGSNLGANLFKLCHNTKQNPGPNPKTGHQTVDHQTPDTQ